MDEMTPLKALSQAGQKLEKAQIPNAQNEARFILLDVMGTDMAGLLRNGTKPMGEAKLSLYRQKIEQRVSGRPRRPAACFQVFGCPDGLHLV